MPRKQVTHPLFLSSGLLLQAWLELSMIWWDDRPYLPVGSDQKQATSIDLCQSVGQHNSTQLLAVTIDIDDDYVRQAGRFD